MTVFLVVLHTFYLTFCRSTWNLFFLLSEVNTHTHTHSHAHTAQGPINHIIGCSIIANWKQLKCISYLLISILSDSEFTSLALLLSCLQLDNCIIISSCLRLCCHFLLLPGILKLMPGKVRCCLALGSRVGVCSCSWIAVIAMECWDTHGFGWLGKDFHGWGAGTVRQLGEDFCSCLLAVLFHCPQIWLF